MGHLLDVKGRRFVQRLGLNDPGVFAQVAVLGIFGILSGLLGLAGAFGEDSGTRLLGVILLILGLGLTALAVHRLRR